MVEVIGYDWTRRGLRLLRVTFKRPISKVNTSEVQIVILEFLLYFETQFRELIWGLV